MKFEKRKRQRWSGYGLLQRLLSKCMFGNVAYEPIVIINCHLKCTKFCVRNHYDGSTLPKICTISKNASNKSCSEYLFLNNAIAAMARLWWTLNNNMLFLNLVNDATDRRWMLWYFNDAINLARIASLITRSGQFTETNQELGSLGSSWVRVGFKEPNPSSENQVRATLLQFDLLSIFINFLSNYKMWIVNRQFSGIMDYSDYNTRISENYFRLE